MNNSYFNFKFFPIPRKLAIVINVKVSIRNDPSSLHSDI